MYIYLAEPIDQAPRGIPSVEGSLAMELVQRKLNFYSPKAAWVWNGDMTSELQSVNGVALRGAHAVAAVLRKGVPTLGVPIECERAVQAGIPLVVCADFARVNSGIFAHMNCVWTTSPEAAAKQLAMIMVMHKEPKLVTWNVADFVKVSVTDETPEPLVARWQQDEPVYSSGVAPRTHNPGDAGYDLTCTENMRIPSGKTRSVACGIKVQLPDGYWGLIQGRSSSWKRGLSVKASVIDAGYRGALWVDLLNISSKPVEVEAGERIAQLIPMPLAPPMVWLRSELTETERGSNGYGSTGK